MPDSIDEQAYRDGLAAFDAGATLRSVFERLASDASAGIDAEPRGMSFALGFADGALGALRKAAGLGPRLLTSPDVQRFGGA